MRASLGCAGALVVAAGACVTTAPTVASPASTVASSAAATPTDPEQAAWAAWRAHRNESLAGPEGWVTLVGLFWLSEGDNTVGSVADGAVVLPADRAPARVGTLTVGHGHVHLAVTPGVTVTHDGTPVTALDLATDADAHGPTVVTAGSLTMRVIARGGRLALRVKDREHPARARFRPPEFFPWDARWRIPAYFTPTPDHTVSITNVLGAVESQPAAGTLTFTLDQRTVSLVALWADDHDPAEGLFVILRDATAADQRTYPAGRFLDVPAPDAQGATVMDFNRLETPPCGFTPYATCPLPPAQNRLDVAIPAGERNPHAHE